MQRSVPILFAALTLMLAGCAQTVNRDELFELAIQSQGKSNPAIMYYKGSNAIYDYYALRHHNGEAGDGIFRVPRDRSQTLPRFSVTEDRSKWIQVFPPLVHRSAIRGPEGADPQFVPKGKTSP
jgi:hypothetical protein